MSIRYIQNLKLFVLDTERSSYAFRIDADGRPIHLHYGGRLLGDGGLVDQDGFRLRASFSPFPEGTSGYRTPDALQLEFSGFNSSDFRITSAAVRRPNGSQIADGIYESHRVISGKPRLTGLPSSFETEDEQAVTLELTLKDPACDIRYILSYSVFEKCDVITRTIRVKNDTGGPVSIERIMSLQLDFSTNEMDFIDVYGAHLQERIPERTPLRHGIQSVKSNRGSSGHQSTPAIALVSRDASEEHGDAYGIMLEYSGSYVIEAECEQFGTTRVCAGICPDNFSWRLEPGELFEAPEAILTYSDNGLGGMSRNFHDFIRQHVIRDGWASRKRPILVNSWEAAYFDFDAKKLLGIAKAAADLGIEMLVLDDGWFGKRNDDKTSLGDWFVNTEKIGDLGKLVGDINALGVKFGLWFEPEMISEQSELYKAHPDWVLHEPGRRRSIGRQQMMLDMSRPEIVQYLFDTIASILRSANIEYIKWDMNRNLTEVYSEALPPERQGEVTHRYMLGVYRLHEMLLKEFPSLLIEGCSGGGGRYDAGMLHYVPQIWCSDNTDALERIRIQLGTSLFYPNSTMGAHVSVCPCHATGRSTPFKTRGYVAFQGTFGYELDLTKLSDEDRATVSRQIEDFHKYHQIVADGDFYRLSDIFSTNAFDAWLNVSKDKRTAILTEVTRISMLPPCIRYLRLRGLDANTIYDVNGSRISGATLMSRGLVYNDDYPPDGDSKMIVIKAID